MQTCLTLYSTFPPPHPGKLLFSSSAQKYQAGEVSLTIYEKCIVQISNQHKNYIHFDFQLKFTFQNNPPSILLEKIQEKIVYYLNSEEELRRCREILGSKLNQRGFHEQFKPKKKIGKGNFASVYLAEKIEDGRSYAVKAFSKEAAYREDKGKECLLKEIEIMRSINHKNCMKLFEVFESDNSLYIVVELLEGGLLYDKIKSKHKFKHNQIREVISSILLGLKEMHSKKIMHRDLKPENLIFRQEGSWDCVIADFGLAEFSDQSEYLFVRCGTPGYVAPQVINIKDMSTKYEPICDIFSLGLIFHILLLGTSAFPGKNYNEVLAQNRASNITFEGEEYRRLDPHALNLLIKMLKKNPLERITAVEALKHPYFDEAMDDEQGDVVNELAKEKEVEHIEYPLIDSPFCRGNNTKPVKKDSCVEFKMGKENIFTGKVDTIAETGSATNSVGRKFESFIAPKASKFTAKN